MTVSLTHSDKPAVPAIYPLLADHQRSEEHWTGRTLNAELQTWVDRFNVSVR